MNKTYESFVTNVVPRIAGKPKQTLKAVAGLGTAVATAGPAVLPVVAAGITIYVIGKAVAKKVGNKD